MMEAPRGGNIMVMHSAALSRLAELPAIPTQEVAGFDAFYEQFFPFVWQSQPAAPPDAQPEFQPATKPAAKATVQETLTAETALVKKAHLALRGGDANAALALLDQHAREYPRGQLREERAAARVLALCRLGRKDEAKRAAGRMLDERSPLAERIRSACGF